MREDADGDVCRWNAKSCCYGFSSLEVPEHPTEGSSGVETLERQGAGRGEVWAMAINGNRIFLSRK